MGTFFLANEFIKRGLASGPDEPNITQIKYENTGGIQMGSKENLNCMDEKDLGQKAHKTCDREHGFFMTKWVQSEMSIASKESFQGYCVQRYGWLFNGVDIPSILFLRLSALHLFLSFLSFSHVHCMLYFLYIPSSCCIVNILPPVLWGTGVSRLKSYHPFINSAGCLNSKQ